MPNDITQSHSDTNQYLYPVYASELDLNITNTIACVGKKGMMVNRMLLRNTG